MPIESVTTGSAAGRESSRASGPSQRDAGDRSALFRLLQHRKYYWQFFAWRCYGAVRRLRRARAQSYATLKPFIEDKSGLEIGGPSSIFRANGVIPVYNVCRSIDSCNFARETIWSCQGDFDRYRAPLGVRFVAEATELSPVRDGSYDFVLASHVLEHVANPLRTLREWARVTKPGGALVIIVPDKRNTFDHRRPYTTYEHLMQDFRAGAAEDDLTHLEEVLRFHDFAMEPPRESWLEFEQRCKNNLELRSMHHHVFSADTITRALEHAGLQVLSVSAERPIHILALAQKPVTGRRDSEQR